MWDFVGSVFRNKVVIASVVFLVSLVVSFMVLYKANVEGSVAEIRSDILNWNHKLSADIVKHGSSEILENVSEGLKKFPLKFFTFEVGGEESYSWKREESVTTKGCQGIGQDLYIRGGVRVGHFSGCISERAVFWKTAFSSSMLAIAFLIAAGLGSAIFFSLRGYKKTLEKLLVLLRGWVARKGNGGFSGGVKLDSISVEIVAMVAQVIESRLKVQEVRRQARTQKQFIELTKQALHDVEGPINSLKKQLRLGESALEPEVYSRIVGTLDRVHGVVSDLREGQILEDPTELLPLKEIAERMVNSKSIVHPEIQFNCEYADDKARVLAQESGLERVFENLLSNAVEAMEGGRGSISIKCSSSISGKVSVVIADSGMGIHEDEVRKVFARNYTQGKANGTGLGLFHAKKKMTDWQGEIALKSEKGSGTFVELTFLAQELGGNFEQGFVERKSI